MTQSVSRLTKLTDRLGAVLPPEYVEFLQGHRAVTGEWIVASNPDYWGVSCFFELAGGGKDQQVDAVYRILWDVLPAGTLPIDENEAGNLYLLDCNEGPAKGSLLWWDHERELGDVRTELVSRSLADFLRLLTSPS